MKKLLVIILFVLVVAGLIGRLISLKAKLDARKARWQQIANQKFEEAKITLIEGWTNNEVFNYLSKQNLGSAADYIKAQAEIDSSRYPALQDNPKKADLQGFLFPDTYRVAKDVTPKEILEKLLNTFESKFEVASQDSKTEANYFIVPGYERLNFRNRVAPGFSVFDLVTLASIIEKETGRAGEPATSDRLLTERRTVAGIFMNRLSQGMPLQSDATVNYVTKAGLASPTLDQTKVDSPYNTYKYPGLPPGPIANISYSSLYAVLHPIKTDYFYFLHSQTAGEVYYGRTLEEHNRNKTKYLK